MGVSLRADKKKGGNLEPNLKDVLTEGNFHASGHQTPTGQKENPGVAVLRGWPSLTLSYTVWLF